MWREEEVQLRIFTSPLLTSLSVQIHYSCPCFYWLLPLHSAPLSPENAASHAELRNRLPAHEGASIHNVHTEGGTDKLRE